MFRLQIDPRRLAIRAASMFVSGVQLHHAALEAACEERWEHALLLLEEGARRYRREGEVLGLARLRVHQLMIRANSGCEPSLEVALCLEVERRLALLDSLESLEPPFELVAAHTLFGVWRHGAETDVADSDRDDDATARAA